MPFFEGISRSRIVLWAALTAVLGGCGSRGENAPLDVKGRQELARNRRGSNQQAAAAMQRRYAPQLLSEKGPRNFASTAPYATHVGYLVRGTDMMLFMPCGEKDDYFLFAPPAVLARVKQYYRFMTRRPYVPVYMELTSRLVVDTLTVGSVTYKRIADAKDFTSDSLGAPKCARPAPGEVMDRVRRYEPDL